MAGLGPVSLTNSESSVEAFRSLTPCGLEPLSLQLTRPP
jgi:hypothetical protein